MKAIEEAGLAEFMKVKVSVTRKELLETLAFKSAPA
jgi:hypothetical protein